MLFSLILCSTISCDRCVDDNWQEEAWETKAVGDELKHNWLLLKSQYLYADELGDFESYNISNKSVVERVSSTDYLDIKAMYSSLSDPFTRYYTPPVSIKVDSIIKTSTRYYGLGFFYEIIQANDESQEDSIWVYRVIPDGPADKAGLRPGDYILAIDGIPLDTMIVDSVYIDTLLIDDLTQDSLILDTLILDTITLTSLINRLELADKIGVEKDLLLFRDSSKILIKAYTGSIKMPTVWLDTLYDDIALIDIDVFQMNTIGDSIGTAEEFKNHFNNIKNYDKIIIDLRDNTGGMVSEVLGVAEVLFEPNQELYHYVTRVDLEKVDDKPTLDTIYQYATDKALGLAKGKEIVVLTSDYTASASEMLLAMLKSVYNVVSFGDISYGKAVVQVVNNINATGDNEIHYGGEALITTALNYMNNGETWNLKGIEPNYYVDPNYALPNAISYLSGTTILLAKQNNSNIIRREKITSSIENNYCESKGIENLKCCAIN